MTNGYVINLTHFSTYFAVENSLIDVVIIPHDKLPKINSGKEKALNILCITLQISLVVRRTRNKINKVEARR